MEERLLDHLLLEQLQQRAPFLDCHLVLQQRAPFLDCHLVLHVVHLVVVHAVDAVEAVEVAHLHSPHMVVPQPKTL